MATLADSFLQVWMEVLGGSGPWGFPDFGKPLVPRLVPHLRTYWCPLSHFFPSQNSDMFKTPLALFQCCKVKCHLMRNIVYVPNLGDVLTLADGHQSIVFF